MLGFFRKRQGKSLIWQKLSTMWLSENKPTFQKQFGTIQRCTKNTCNFYKKLKPRP